MTGVPGPRDGGAPLAGQALAVPATPANAVDGPSGFDPSRMAEIAFGRALLADKGFDPLAVWSLMTSPQRRALRRMEPSGLYDSYKTSRQIGTNGSTLMALNDLWRDERGCEAPIMLATWDVDADPWGIRRVWSLTSEGWAVLYAIATETRRAGTENTGSVEDEGAGPQDIAQTPPGDSN